MDIVNFRLHLEKELEDIGTVSAIGLDTPGIAHISTLDDEWETTMRNLSERAGCIIYVPGYSEGAVKEFQHIIDHALYKTLIISVPSTGGFRSLIFLERERISTFGMLGRFGANV